MTELLSRLSRLDSCVVSDALDKLGLTGVAIGLSRQSTEKKLAGRVLTVKLEAAEGRMATRHLCTAAIEEAAAGDIIVVEHHSRSDCAGWGGLLSRAASIRGIPGVIVDGLCRDIDESRELGFTVFARGVIPATARGRIVETDFNCPIMVGGVQVEPGDWVIADGSGVVFLRRKDTEVVLNTAEQLVAREAALLQEIEAGVPVSKVMSRTYEHMTRKNQPTDS